MKPLREYIGIHESILDIDSNLKKDDIKVLIEDWLDENGIKYYTINNDYTIDVDSYVGLSNRKDLVELPEYINFNYVKEYFVCYNCKNLRSLRGVPRVVGRSFDCSHCDSLTSLEGGPEMVMGNFQCTGCKELRALKGAPLMVKGSFDCHGCPKLKTLEGAPKCKKIYSDIK